MPGPLASVIAQWVSVYSGHAAVRTAVVFVHLGALVGAGGCAIAADRATLLASRRDEAERRLQVEALAGTHQVVIAGLALILASGLLMFAADVETFLYSRVFWIKMGLVVLLLANGAALTAAERRATRGDGDAWDWLRLTAMASIALWLSITLAGVALTNVG
jgi:uncharacterized membrane protein